MTTAVSNAWQRWRDFWFAAADPTPLGFMRAVTGVLILYVHVVYSLDLQAFFGKDGWYSLASVNRERHEYPHMIGPFRSYDEPYRAASVPEFPHRRQAVMAYIRAMPADAGSRREALGYLIRLQNTGHNPTVRDGLEYLERIGTAGPARKAQLDAFEEEKLRTAVDIVPEYLGSLKPEDRAAVRREIELFLEYLPADFHQRQFVLNHLNEIDLGQRRLFLEFLTDLPADAAARKQVIDYMEFWSNEARRAYRTGNPVFSIWFHITDPTSMAVAHGVILVAMLFFTVGLFTRVSAIVVWLAAVSYIHRTQHVLFGMDTMMNILLVYLTIGNSGAAFSVDRLINRYKAARAGLARSGTIEPRVQAYLDHPPYSPSAGFALRCVQVHFCFIYMASGLSKLKGAAWWQTTAFWDTMINPEFTLVQFQWYEKALRLLVEERWVFAIACGLGVAFTFVMEIGFPFLVWTRQRPYALIAAFFLHFGIAACMGLNLFGLFMMTLLLAYIPGGPMREAFTGTAAKLAIRFASRDPAQQRAAALAKAFAPQAELSEGPAFKVTANGKDVPAATLLGGWGKVPILGPILARALGV